MKGGAELPKIHEKAVARWVLGIAPKASLGPAPGSIYDDEDDDDDDDDEARSTQPPGTVERVEQSWAIPRCSTPLFDGPTGRGAMARGAFLAATGYTRILCVFNS